MLTNKEIQKILPHRYPFLLVDRIIEMEEGTKAVGIKNVTVNEPFFQGHFPGEPIMPGVLIVEAMAQVGAVALLSKDENRGKLALFTGIENMKFKSTVTPGDTLTMTAEVTGMRLNIGKANVKATLADGKIAAAGEIKFALVDA